MSGRDRQLFDLTVPPSPAAYLREAWRRRDFAIQVPVQDLRAQNMGTALGQLWHLANPALLVGVYFLIFGVVIDTSRGVENFLGFLIVGVVLFHLTQRVVQDAAVCISRNLGLIRSVQFPRILLPAATLNGQTAAFVPALALAVLAVVVTGERPALRWRRTMRRCPKTACFLRGRTLRCPDDFRRGNREPGQPAALIGGSAVSGTRARVAGVEHVTTRGVLE